MPSPPVVAPRPPLDPGAALLSYLIPGLGQVVRGRIGKGILFFVGLYGLFFYGLAVGQFKNVWLPDPTDLPDAELPLVGRLGGVPKALYHRNQFLGQFWIGAAAWPAAAQYMLSSYPPDGTPPPPTPVLGRYMQAPTELELNTLQRDGNKRWDLAWVYTVIAGALNVLVIYDALAGPMVRDEQETPPAPAPGGVPA